MKTIDVRGKKCPMPLIETKKALKERSGDEEISIIIDNENSRKNVLRYLSDNQIPVQVIERGAHVELLLSKGEQLEIIEDAASYCTSENNGSEHMVILFSKDRIGEGDEELGQFLVGGFLKTLLAEDKKPASIIFMNSGINLVLKDSPFIVLLSDLEKAGIELLVCGTCLDFYEKNEALAVGSVSNMVEIYSRLSITNKLINF
jgi:selenium metabolism protein YedF